MNWLLQWRRTLLKRGINAARLTATYKVRTVILSADNQVFLLCSVHPTARIGKELEIPQFINTLGIAVRRKPAKPTLHHRNY